MQLPDTYSADAAKQLRAEAMRIEALATAHAHLALSEGVAAEEEYVLHHGESVGAARRRIIRAKALFGRGKVKAKLREHFLEGRVSAENIDVALAKVRKLSKASAVPPLQIVLEVVERSLHENLTHAAFGALVAERVNEINTALGVRPARPRRHLQLCAQDAHGGVRVRGYLTAAQAAVVKHSLEAEARNSYKEGDKRTWDQRMADALVAVCKEPSGRGTKAALVVSVTARELGEPVRRLYPTNTGHWLSAEEAAELIDPEDSYLAIHHPVSLEVLAFGRTRRLASQFQRLALWLEHPVCMYPGCSVPASRCQAHHIVPWDEGGGTNLDNLALLCPHHHGKVIAGRGVERVPNKVWVDSGTPMPNSHPAAKPRLA